MEEFTLEKIKGIEPKNMLPNKVGLVLEGGGTRGYYSAGVMDAFLKADIMFPYVIGVSAGAGNATSFISGQIGRNKQMIEHFITHKRYVSFTNYMKNKSVFGMDFIFGEIPQKHCFFDWDMLKKSKTRFLTGAFDCEKGETVWFEKEDLRTGLGILIASCSLPFFSPMVKYKKKILLDGGILHPIPIEKSIEDGNEFHVIILTQNEGYQKKGKKYAFFEFYYRMYPKLVETMKIRHEIYNQQVELCEELQRQGKAIIIRPLQSLEVSRMTKDVKKLLALYQEGEDETQKVIEILKEKYRINS